MMVEKQIIEKIVSNLKRAEKTKYYSFGKRTIFTLIMLSKAENWENRAGFIAENRAKMIFHKKIK